MPTRKTRGKAASVNAERVPTGTKPGTNPVQKFDGRSFHGNAPTSRGPIPGSDKSAIQSWK